MMYYLYVKFKTLTRPFRWSSRSFCEQSTSLVPLSTLLGISPPAWTPSPKTHPCTLYFPAPVLRPCCPMASCPHCRLRTRMLAGSSPSISSAAPTTSSALLRRPCARQTRMRCPSSASCGWRSRRTRLWRALFWIPSSPMWSWSNGSTTTLLPAIALIHVRLFRRYYYYYYYFIWKDTRIMYS